ncbi:protein kinase [Myxococcota bacterium]|nr:protein kinase [Myxococcota bacterium]
MSGPVAHVVGPFELHEVVGRGGMGVVWAAVHRGQRTPVAFKVLTHRAAENPAFRQAFRDEIRAVAGLSHPGIVEVYEHGEIEQMLEPEGELRPGHPYLAMEWVGGGSLVPACGHVRWPALRGILRQLLDALAHAHARGIVHRDLKPANVLRSPGGGWLKLTDFGVALSTRGDAPTAGGGIAGTPEYMAPEQIEGRFRDLGPATDLYGLGCMAWELCTGRTPFEDDDPTRVLTAHLLDPLPPFAPRHAVPDGFEAWLSRLLEKRPGARFARAADAAWALMQLGAAPLDALAGDDTVALSHLGVMPTSAPHTLIFGTPIRHQTTLESVPALEDEPPHAGPPTPLRGEHAPRSPFAAPGEPQTDPRFSALSGEGSEADGGDAERPPMPPSWRRPEPPPWSARLMGAGLGLFGLRSVPFVGRETERDLLWEDLRAVGAEGRARLVLVTGAAGLGASRLCAWLSERADELGAATPLSARFTDEPGARPPLAAMMMRHFALFGLGYAEMTARLEAAGVAAAGTVAAWLAGPAPGELELPRAVDRVALIRRVVEGLAVRRPVVLFLDDVPAAPEAVELARHLLDAQFFSPCRVLLLCTARDEALAVPGPAPAELRALLTRPGTRRLALGPLTDAERPQLVRSLLGFSEELTARLVARTGGNPQMAVQLVSDWVARGLLAPHDRGFRFARGAASAAEEVPDTLRASWRAQVERLLAGRSPAFVSVIERAAVLGAEVDLGEWACACAETGPEVTGAALEVLALRRLVRPRFDAASAGQAMGFEFVSMMLVEALWAHAADAGRLEAHHAACATLLSSRSNVDAAERLGRHLAGAGRPEAALDPLAAAARIRLTAGEYLRTATLLERHEACVEGANLPAHDDRRGEGWALRARLFRARGEFHDADAWAARAEAAARRHGWPRLLAVALLERGRLAWHLGEPERAADRLGLARRQASEIDDARLVAECDWQLADLDLGRGQLAGAAAGFDRARTAFIALGDAVSAGKAGLSLGEVARQLGRHDEAAAHIAAARGWLDAGGARWGAAECENKLGELARAAGDMAGAAAHYREAARLYRELGSGMALYPELNLGVVQVEDGRYDEARPVLEGVLNVFIRQGTRGMVGAGHVCLMACCAGQNDGPGFDVHAAAAAADLEASGFVDVDNARLAERAGDRWAERGETGRAQVAWALARSQWAALGRADDAARLAAASTPAG